MEARAQALAEAEDLARVDRVRTLADRTSTEAKDLIAAAEAALRANAPDAVGAGRRAAVALLTSDGTWTREAAEFALAGADADVRNWVDTDRQLAQRQDDRENVLAVARVATAAVAAAAQQALVSSDPNAARVFLETGLVQAAATDNRATVFRILAENPGKAVKAKAEAALDNGGARALHHFLTVELAEAVKEDDHVEVFRLLASGGLYTKAAAQIVLEGSARMRRHFVMHDQYEIARLDHDRASHVAAIRASIAHGARVAAKAHQDAARASEAAAQARQAAQDASDWALKADGYAQDAERAAGEARTSADEADRSAAEAAASAKKAEGAASVARGAARTANYSMRQAVQSARQAATFAAQAQASASQAHASAVQAGQDAEAAAAAAGDAHRIAADKRDAELRAQAQQAAEEAKRHQQANTSPVGPVDDDGDTKYWGMWPEDVKDTKDWATVTGHWSSVLGTASAALCVGALFFPPLGVAATVVGAVSLGLQGASAVLSGISYGLDDARFHQALGAFALGAVFLGKGQVVKKFGEQTSKAVGAAMQNGADAIGNAVTSVVGFLTW
ncbi:ALF repeat-containing protein (plasmid) [Streptomyces sp. BI20]|uniref:ALF repeat-containing protein n=1 Tax=Streptomyces sp. BI20 TaxID=3403460 RepID=UPI003C74B5A1